MSSPPPKAKDADVKAEKEEEVIVVDNDEETVVSDAAVSTSDRVRLGVC